MARRVQDKHMSSGHAGWLIRCGSAILPRAAGCCGDSHTPNDYPYLLHSIKRRVQQAGKQREKNRAARYDDKREQVVETWRQSG
jgi:hypothetical protein